MLDVHRRANQSEPLPLGYRVIRSRRCVFRILNPSGCHRGLAYAILLRAVEDGCNPKWLNEIAGFYEISVPPKMFEHKPASMIICQRGADKFTALNVVPGCRRPLLSWTDGLFASGTTKMIG